MIVVLSLCVFFDIFSVKALSNIDHVSKLFEEFIIKCFNDEENVLVYDGEREISDDFLNLYRNSYNNGDLATINKAIVDNNYEIKYIKEEPSTRASTVVAKTFESYESGYDRGNRYFKEWLTSLYCRFSYNPSTGNITYIYDPQLSVEFVGWGGAFSPSIYDVSTSKRQASRLSVEYSCSYKVRAELTLHDYLPSLNLDYGSCGHTYTLKA